MKLHVAPLVIVGIIIFTAVTGLFTYDQLNGTNVTGTVTGTVQSICQAGAPIISQAQASNKSDPTVENLLTYAQSACNLDGTVASALGVNMSTSTPTWLEGVLTALETAAKLVPIVLPALSAA